MKNCQVFGILPNGTEIETVSLKKGALSCRILTYGGALQSLTVPDRQGNPVDVVLGLDTLEAYCEHDKFLGALVGRYANRIANGKFVLGGKEYSLFTNDGPNHLHGGAVGYNQKVWKIEDLQADQVVLSLLSPDGEEGYPGNLPITMTYRLTEQGLELSYEAESDADTVCNLTNHSYFNLAGHGSGVVDSQTMQLFADRYTHVREGAIPTGELPPVDGTPMDLRQPTPIGVGAESDFEQLVLTQGFDHNWVINDWDGTMRPAACAYAKETGIRMQVLTTLPGIQFYAGNYLDGCPAGKGGAKYYKHCGFCMETQFFPDTPNQPSFPSALLRKGEKYLHKTAYLFDIAE